MQCFSFSQCGTADDGRGDGGAVVEVAEGARAQTAPLSGVLSLRHGTGGGVGSGSRCGTCVGGGAPTKGTLSDSGWWW